MARPLSLSSDSSRGWVGHSRLSPPSCWPGTLVVMVLPTPWSLGFWGLSSCLGSSSRCREGSTRVSRGTGAGRSHQPCWKGPKVMVLTLSCARGTWGPCHAPTVAAQWVVG